MFCSIAVADITFSSQVKKPPSLQQLTLIVAGRPLCIDLGSYSYSLWSGLGNFSAFFSLFFPSYESKNLLGSWEQIALKLLRRARALAQNVQVQLQASCKLYYKQRPKFPTRANQPSSTLECGDTVLDIS